MVAKVKSDPNAVFAGSVPYLKLAGIVFGGWQMARALLVASDKRGEDESFYGAKIATAQFFAEHILSQAPGDRSVGGQRQRAGRVSRAERGSVLMR